VPLTLAQVHAALACYYDHPQEFAAAARESEQWEAEYERDRADHLRMTGGEFVGPLEDLARDPLAFAYPIRYIKPKL
jgi:hypothetical protein